MGKNYLTVFSLQYKHLETVTPAKPIISEPALRAWYLKTE
jgi:hypothetical protein